ncbi:hypothetical protein [Methylocaldum sp.]|nr:hypothetical protein [Methylocaldum sp.]HYE35656.1 hypothetical protein [Methylocaldum sp.]
MNMGREQVLDFMQIEDMRAVLVAVGVDRNEAPAKRVPIRSRASGSAK